MVASADHAGDPASVIAALPLLDCELADLRRAEDAGILELGAAIRFSHPLLRSAVYHQATAGERRAAHAAPAAAVSRTESPEHRAWHRALSVESPDEQAALELAGVADSARARGAPAEAASAYELAAQLTVDRERRSGRLYAAGECQAFAGHIDAAGALLAKALRETSVPERRLAIRIAQARLCIASGSSLDAHALLTEEAHRLEASAPAQGALLHAEAAIAMMAAGRPRDVLTSAEASYRLAEAVGGRTLMIATVTLAEALLAVGEATAGEAMLDSVLESLGTVAAEVVWQPLRVPPGA